MITNNGNDLTNVDFSIIIGGFQKSSLIDYPGKISAIIFTQGCNFRCPYCHNPELIKKNGANALALAPILDFLKQRKGKLDGVVITGGEPTLHKGLPEFIRQIKNLGFCVKLDTNGTNPDMLKKLIDDKLIDYVAMDIKAPIEKYGQVTCTKVSAQNIFKSITILKASNIDYEFRTTVVKSQLLPQDFEQIGQMIQEVPKYYLQRFQPTKTLDDSFIGKTTYSDKEFKPIMQDLRQYIKTVELRG